MAYNENNRSLLDIDGDGTVDALTDGLLILRHMFGVRNNPDNVAGKTSLTKDAVALNASRTISEIEDHLDELFASGTTTRKFLDIDRDGDIDALTDGLLILRHTFGLSSESGGLTEGAVSLQSPLTAQEITNSLRAIENLVPKKNAAGEFYVTTEDGTALTYSQFESSTEQDGDTPDYDGEGAGPDITPGASFDIPDDPEDPLGTPATFTLAPGIISGAAAPSTPPTPPSAPQELYVPRDLTFDELYKLATQNKVPARYAYLPVFKNFDRDNLPQEFSDIYKNGGASGKLRGSDVVRLQGQGFFPEEVLPDADYDGFHDGVDKFPNDPTKWFDEDNDGVDDFNDAFPNNPAESVDTDGDGTGDNADQIPDDPRFTITADRDEFVAQDEVNRFVLQNSRKLVGAKQIADFRESDNFTKHKFAEEGLKEFKAWRTGFARQHNRLPNDSDIWSWMAGQESLVWKTVPRHGRVQRMEPWAVLSQKHGNKAQFMGTAIRDYLDDENAWVNTKDVRVSDRSFRKDALLDWVQADQPTSGTLWTGIFGDDVEVTPGAERLVEVLAIQDNKTNGTYTPHSSLSASDKKLLERYEQAVNTTFEAIDNGTTPWDLEQLINAGKATRLADWFQGGMDDIVMYDSFSAFKKNATDEEKEIYREALVQRVKRYESDSTRERVLVESIRSMHINELLILDFDASFWQLSRPDGRGIITRVPQSLTNGFASLAADYEYAGLLTKIKGFDAPSYIELPSALDMDLGGVNYDRDRLYMKMPGDDEVRLGKYNHTAVGPDGKPLYLNQSEIREAFSTPIPHGLGSGAGYFVDITDGEAEVGEYSMLWVELQEKPEWYERLIDDLGPLKAILQIGAVLIGRPDIAFQISAVEVGFKVLTGQTLHAEDWASLAIVGLAKFGKITMPMGEAQAADAAKAAATAEGLKAGTQAFDAFVASQTAINVAGIGLGGMTAKQTMTLIRAAGAGDLRGAILPVLSDFGDGWIKNGLGSLGVSDSVIDSISPGQIETINEVVSDMAEGASFEEAMTGQALDWLDDAVGGSDKLKQFFEGFEGDLQNILRVAEEFIVNEDIKAIGDHLLDSIKDMPLTDIVQQLEDNFEDGLKKFEDLLDQADIVDTFNKELVQPLEDTVNQFIAPLVAKAKVMDLELPDSIQAQIDKVTADFNEYIGEQAYNLDDATEAAVKQGIIQAVLDNDGTYAGKAKIANAFTRELVIQQEIGKMDNKVVDALSPAVVAAGMRSVLNGVLLQNPNIGDNALKAMVSVARTSITNSLESGTFVTDFKTWMDGVTTRTEDTITAKEELESIQAQGDALGQELLSAKAKRDALVKRRTDLEALAEAPNASQADVEAYGALLVDDDYQAELVAATQDVIRISGEIKTLEATELTAVAGYEESKNELSIYNRVAPELQAYERDLFKDVVEDIDENFNAPEYASQQGIPLEEAHEHYISQGLLAGAPTTNAEANDRLDAAISRVYADVVESSGIDDKRLSPVERSAIMNDIRVKVLNDAPTVTGGSFDVLNFIESPEFAEYAATVNWDKQALDTLNTIHEEDMGSIAEFNNALLGRDYTSFLSDPGNPLFYMKDMSTGEKDQYIKDLVDGNLFRTANAMGEYEWVSGNAYLVLGDDGKFYQENAGINGITLVEASLSDPDVFGSVVGSIPNVDAVELLNARSREFTPAGETPETMLPKAGMTDAELPWIVRVIRDQLEAKRAKYAEIESEYNALKDKENLTPAERRELRGLRGQLDKADEDYKETILWTNTISKWADAGNMSVIAMTVGIQETEAMRMGELARRDAIENGIDPVSAREIGERVEQDLLDKIDYSVLSDNDFSKTVDMLTAVANGYLPPAYVEVRDAMYADWDAAEGPLNKVGAIFSGLYEYPEAMLHEIILPEIGETLIQLVGAKGAGLVTKQAAKGYGKEIAEAAADKVTVGANVIQDIVVEYGATVEGAYDESVAALRLKNEELIAEGKPPLYTELEIQQIAFDISIQAGTTAILLLGATASFNFKLDNKILNSSSYGALNSLGEKMVDYADVLGKEAVSEVIQEVGAQGAVENGLYGAGVDNRNVSENLAQVGAIAAIASAGTTTALYGLTTPTQNILKDTDDPFASTILTQNPQIQDAIKANDLTEVKQLLTDIGVNSMPETYNAIMNAVDDTNFITYLEAEKAFEYIGVRPRVKDIEYAVALSDTLALSYEDFSLDEQLAAYWQNAFGSGAIGTGRTTAQNYDIIKHLENMRDGTIPLDATFIDEQTGESTLTQDVIDDYIASLPQREQDLIANYNVANHVPTNIVEELGGSLMTQDQINAVNKAIKDLQDAPDAPTAPEVLEILLADDSIGGIPAQVKNLVDAAFSDADAQAAFAATVVQALIDDGSLKTLSVTEVANALGSSEVGKESGIYLALKELAADIASGDTDVTGLVTTLTAKVNTLNKALVAQGAADSTARDAITSLIGSNVEDEESGIYKILKDLEGGQSTTDQAVAALDTAYKAADSAQDATIAAIATNVGAPAEDGKKATGLHLIVEEAIAAESSAREAILGDYVDFAAFETALGTATDNKINSLKTTFGVPGEYKTDKDGNIVYKDDGSPDWKTVPTGYFLDAYNASQLEGEERDDALTVLQGQISQTLKTAKGFGTSEAERVKTEIMDEYFPTPPPELGAIERDILEEVNYMSFLMRNDQYDATRDETGDGIIGPLDIDEFLSSFDDDTKSLVYQHLVYQDNGTLAGEVRRAIVDSGTTYDVLNTRITTVNNALTKTITDNVLDVIGTPERKDGGTTYGATGLFKLIEDGDADIEQVIGKIGDKGFGILRSLEIAGLDIDAIQNFLDTNVGKPATDGEDATGLFAVTGANAAAISSLTSSLSEYKTAVSLQFTNLESSLKAAIATAVSKGESGDAALDTAIQAVAGDLETTESTILSKLGTDIAGVKEAFALDLSGLKTALQGEITAAVSKGETGDAALQSAIDALSGKVSTDDAAILSQLAADKTALQNAFALDLSGLKTALQGEITAAVSKGESGDAALQSAIDALSGKVSTDDAAILSQLAADKTALQNAFALDLSGLKTALQGEITAAISKGETGDAALQSAIDALAGKVSTDDAAILSQLAADKTALQNAFALDLSGLKTALQGEITAAISKGETGDAALQSAIDALAGKVSTDDAAILSQLAADKTALQNAFALDLSGLKTALQGEITAAVSKGESGDAALQSAIDALSGKVSTDDAAILSQLAADKTALQNAFALDLSGLKTALQGEITAAISKGETGDAALQSAIDALAGKVSTDDAAILSQLAADKTALQNAFALDLSGLKTALQGEITAAISKGETGDAALQSAIDALAGKVSTDDAAILSQLAADKTALQNAFALDLSGLKTALQGEITAAISKGETGDAALQSAIDALAGKVSTDDAAILSQLAADKTALQNAFALDLSGLKTALQGEITAAISKGETGDAALQSAIDALAGKVSTADAAILSQLAADKTALQNAFALDLSGLKTALQGEITAAISKGETGDAALQSAIDALAGKVSTDDAAILSQLAADKTALQNAFALDLSGLKTALQGEITAAISKGETGDAALQSAIDALAGKVSTDDAAILSQLATDKTALQNAFALDLSGLKTALQGEITVAVSKGETGDAALQSAIDALAGKVSTDDAAILSQLAADKTALQNAFALDLSGLKTALQAEIFAAKTAGESGDAALQAAIDALSQTVSGADAETLTKLAQDTTALQNAFKLDLANLDTELQAAITAAVSKGESGDAALQTALSALSTRLDAKDSEILAKLGTDIAGVKDAFALDLSGLKTALQGEITAAISKGETGDAALQSAIDALAGKVSTDDAAILSQLAADKTALQNAFALDLSGLKTALQGEITAAISKGETGDAALQSAIDALAGKVSTDDAAILSQLAADKTALQNAFALDLSGLKTALQGEITAAISKGETGDAALQSADALVKYQQMMLQDDLSGLHYKVQ
jgi:hypothetical protein